MGYSKNEYLKSRKLCTSKTQIIHDPKQVKSPEELEVGKVYIAVSRGAILRYKCEIIKSVGKDTWIEVNEIEPNGSKVKKRISLADRGIMPYENGLWNSANYFIPEEKLQPT